jgi:hypothetical protein
VFVGNEILQNSRFAELRSDERSRSDVEKREDLGRMSHRRTGVDVDVNKEKEQH